MRKRRNLNASKWATFRIREVLADHYCRGVDGYDYEEIKEELQAELWKREAKEAEKREKKNL